MPAEILQLRLLDLGALTALDDEGWALSPTLCWMLCEGVHTGEPLQFLDRLGARLLAAGAPLWRARISYRTIHPQVAGLGYTWMRGQRTTEFRALHGFERSDDYLGSPIQQVFETGLGSRYRLDALAPADHQVLHDLAARGGTDYLALPVRFSTGHTSAFIAATDDPAGFDDVDMTKLQALPPFLAPFLEAMSLRRIARTLLDTYVGPRTGAKVLSGVIKRGDGETIKAALWFSDLRDFTELTENLSVDRLLATLNAYFEHVAAAVTARGGEILRFIGDAMLIVFPVEGRHDERAACQAALDAAHDAYASLAALNHRRRRAGEATIRFGLGLHFGEVVYGNVGAPDRLDFTVMGPAVNRTARLEGLTKALGASLLISAEFAARVDAEVRSLGHHPMKGVTEPQEVLALADEVA